MVGRLPEAAPRGLQIGISLRLSWPARQTKFGGDSKNSIYFQLSIAFLWSDSGGYSSNSSLTPLGSIMFVKGALVAPAFGSSIFTPRSRNTVTVLFRSSAQRPACENPTGRSEVAGASSRNVSRLI